MATTKRPNRQFYIWKFQSDRLAAFNYNIESCTINEGRYNFEIASIADNQLLRTIRDIRKRTVNYEHLEKWISIKQRIRKDFLKNNFTLTDIYSSLEEPIPYRKSPKLIGKINNYLSDEEKELAGDMSIKDHIEKICPNFHLSSIIKKKEYDLENFSHSQAELFVRALDKINRTMFIPDYVTVVINKLSHYNYIIKHGVIINGKVYKRLSCSAGQARNSTIVLCNTEIIDEVRRRIDNNRNPDKKLAPSKYNAYFGLAGSGTYVVSEPRAVVIKDYYNSETFFSHFVSETDADEDDIITDKEVTLPMNRFDGMGLISPTQAKKWAEELGLDYIPSQFGIRQSFIKGMLCTFDFVQFCEEVNGGNYIIDTIYTDDEGKPIQADLRECDIILTESQFKLWDCYDNFETYIQSCRENKLYWGVPQYSSKPTDVSNVLKMNYQFIQTLNLSQEDVEQLCQPFVDYIQGVSYADHNYMMLFLCGVNQTEESIKAFLNAPSNGWLKSLALYPELRNDPCICDRIRNLIRTRIRNGYMGEIFIEGNFQTIVSDPYALMQHACGLEVTGLLQRNETYSNYWNEKGVTLVDGMRSPLTFRSEHVLLNLKKNELTEKWYKYCKLGIILNIHGHEVCNFAGADFDLDILATTNNPYVIKGVYQDEYPMTYDVPSPQKIKFSEEDLCNADKFSFGSIIGQITNKSSSAYALLAQLEDEYGVDSAEYQTTYSRLIQCCKAQSGQIDKAKIGREVKGIPSVWIKRNPVVAGKGLGEGLEKEECSELNDFYNSILLKRYPYFFRYRYEDCNNQYKKYLEESNVATLMKFNKTIDELLAMDKRTDEEDEYVKKYYRYMPVIISNSPMNMLCRYLENVDFNITQQTKKTKMSRETVELLKHKSITYTEKEKEEILTLVQEYSRHHQAAVLYGSELNDLHNYYLLGLDEFILRHKSYNIYKIVNILIDHYYLEASKKDKNVIWKYFGQYIYNNIKRNTGSILYFPFPCHTENTNPSENIVTFLGEKYCIKEVDLHKK